MSLPLHYNKMQTKEFRVLSNNINSTTSAYNVINTNKPHVSNIFYVIGSKMHQGDQSTWDRTKTTDNNPFRKCLRYITAGKTRLPVKGNACPVLKEIVVQI